MTIKRTKKATNDNQRENNGPTKNAGHANVEPFKWKAGVSGNPKGRPKGKSMKEFARSYLENMTEEDRIGFMETLDPDLIWKMAEGNPASKSTIDGELKLPVPLIALGDDKS